MGHISIYLFMLIQMSLSSLHEPQTIEMIPGVTYHFSIEYCEFSVPPYITTMNAICYCIYTPTTQTSFDCSIPGPTFIFHPGDQITWTWHNRLVGDGISNPALLNKYRDLDITNIHTHGLHLNPNEDDVLVKITPGSQQTYTYTIPTDHYPGLHWLHAHHHGSVSFQVSFGLFSALLIKYANTNDLLDNSLINMKENILMFHEIYVVTTDLCDCSNTTQWQSFFYYPQIFDVTDCISGKLCFQVFSLCYEYCAMPSGQRQQSGFIYNIQSDHSNNFQLFLVNGQYVPIIDDIKVNTFRRLRFVNAITQYYIQYKFPTTNCQWHIIAIDGIYLTDNEVRNINIFPYFGEYLLAPGGRLDVIVKCSVIGTYDIFSSENNDIDADLLYITRVPTGTTLFTIQVKADGIDTVTTPPASYPPRPNYLKDLRSLTTEPCGCNTYFDPSIDNTRIVTWAENECGFVFNMKHRHNVNGLAFDPTIPSTSLEYGKIYEFILIPHMHPYHQHVNPFQLQQDVGTNGFQGKAADWYDTFGGTRDIQFTFKTYPIDFTGMQIIHCHWLPHEDIGMMTYINILEPHQICNATTGTIVDLSTQSPLSAGATHSPTQKPSISPSQNPSFVPTNVPTNIPTKRPSSHPTSSPSNEPSLLPSNLPTNYPSNVPTKDPSDFPTDNPSKYPTISPTKIPTQMPSYNPTINPTDNPTTHPTYNPTNDPSKYPTAYPTNIPTNIPTNNPTIEPTFEPSKLPTNNPSNSPTYNPTISPSDNPTYNPSVSPTLIPTFEPTIYPTAYPSIAPSITPTQTLTDNTLNVIEYEEDKNIYYTIFGWKINGHSIYFIVMLIGGGFMALICGLMLAYCCVCKNGTRNTRLVKEKDEKGKQQYTNVNKKHYKHVSNESKEAIDLTDKTEEEINPIIDTEETLLSDIIEVTEEENDEMS